MEPNRAKDRELITLARCKPARNEQLLAKCEQSHAESDVARRTRCATDTPLARREQPRKLVEDPVSTRARIDKLHPQRAVRRTDALEDRVLTSCTLNSPRVQTPLLTDKLLPTCAALRSDKDEPKCEVPQMESSVPTVSLARKETPLPRTKKSAVERPAPTLA